MSDFEKLINASDLIEWIMETYPDWCVGDVRGIVDHIDNMPSEQPESCEDTISRKAAIDAIHNADTQIYEGEAAVGRRNYMTKDECCEIIDSLPSARSEIIRCENCKHRPTLDEDGELNFPTYRCPCQCEDFYYSWMPKDDWFCGNAERETDV